MAVGLAAPRSTSARVDPHDHHHGAHSHSHQHKATQSHRSHSHWWHFGHKKPQPQDDEASSSAHGHHHHHVSHGGATKARYARHHTTDSIPSIPEHRPTAFSKRGSVTLQQHDDPRTVSRRKRLVLHAIFKC